MNIMPGDKWGRAMLSAYRCGLALGADPATKRTQSRLPMSHWIIMIDFYYMELQFILLNNKQPNEQAPSQSQGGGAPKAWQQQAWPKSVSKIWMKSYKEITLFIIRSVVQPAGETKRHETTDDRDEQTETETQTQRGETETGIGTRIFRPQPKPFPFPLIYLLDCQAHTHTDTHTQTHSLGQVSSVFSL